MFWKFPKIRDFYLLYKNKKTKSRHQINLLLVDNFGGASPNQRNHVWHEFRRGKIISSELEKSCLARIPKRKNNFFRIREIMFGTNSEEEK